jgi:Helix-turn-helix of DDE superfamily endonuclease
VKHENLKKLSDKNFRRITGVKRTTFDAMIKILKEANDLKKKKGGRSNKLSIENMLLMTLEYLREYRTYAAIAASYGLAESNAFTNIKWVEDTLIKDKNFHLPGRKALLKSDMEFEVILVDAAETPIERPKKNKESFTLEKRRDIL